MARNEKGLLSVEALKARVADGSIDTVINAFPDMRGRLMGKRVIVEVAGRSIGVFNVSGAFCTLRNLPASSRAVLS